MKKKFLVAMAFALTTCFTAYSQTFTLEIKGIEKIKGEMYIGFYKSAKTFLKETSYGVCEKVTGKTMTITINDLPKGSYAISLFQDENMNKKLDTGLFGIPLEKYGFSNDAKGYTGPPSFKKCNFIFNANKKMVINL